MTEEQRSELIKLAGEMVLGEGMPSPDIEDWELPKSTPVKTRWKILMAAKTANDQARRWAVAIGDIVEQDRKETP